MRFLKMFFRHLARSFPRPRLCIDAALKNELSEMTTHKPALLTGTPTVDIVLAPSVARDVSTIGYHYPVLDYIVKDLELENTSLTIKGGAVIGVAVDANSAGVSLQPGKFVSIGVATRPNRFVRLNQVQEGPVDRVPTMVSSGAEGEFKPELTARFTEFSSLAGEASLITMGDEFARMELSHSALINGDLDVDMNPGANQIVGLTNTLFQSVVSTVTGDATASLYAYNNLFKDGEFHVTGANSAWRVYDNVFDHAGVSDTGSGAEGGKNAYVPSTADQLSFDSAPEPLTSLTYVSGPLGRYYVSGITLEDLGSRNADDAGLYHFTTRTSLTSKDEDEVDIGLHYVSLATGGSPDDADTDGLADYLEDSNGNGAVDSSDFADFSKWDTDSDGLSDLQEYQLATLPRTANSRRDAYDAVVNSQSPNGWFKLNNNLNNEVSGRAALSSSGSGLGYGNDVFAIGNSAYSFAAESAKLTLSDGSPVDDPLGGGTDDTVAQGSFTLLFRALNGQADDPRYLLSQGTDVTTTDGNAIAVYVDDDGLKLRVGPVEEIILADTYIARGAWYYLAVTCDETRADNEVRWYLARVGDEALQSESLTLGEEKKFGNNGAITVGNQDGSIIGGYYWDFDGTPPNPRNGYLDQVAFWNRELAGSEITTQFHALPQSDLPNHFDLSKWNLELPMTRLNELDPNDDDTLKISTGWLNSDFEYVDPVSSNTDPFTKKYFYLGTDNTLVFQVPSDGARSGSWPRSELRRTKADGTEDNWYPDDDGGTHILAGTCRIMDNAVGKIVIGQIHRNRETGDPSWSPPITLYVDYRPLDNSPPAPSFIKVAVYNTPGGAATHSYLDNSSSQHLLNVALNTDINYELKLVATDSPASVMLYVKVIYNGVTYVKDVSMNAAWLDYRLFFKAGCYYNNIDANDPDAKVTFSSLSVTP